MPTSVDTQTEFARPKPLHSKWLPTVPALLFRLVLVCLFPALLGAAAITYIEYVRGQSLLHDGVMTTLRDKLDAVDAQLVQAELFAKALSLSGFLSDRDFANFYLLTTQMLRSAKLEYNIVVYDDKGQQLLHTAKPYGSKLPRRQEMGQIHNVFATGKPTDSSVISRTSTGQAMVGFMTPVLRAHKVRYGLTVAFNPKQFESLVQGQYLLHDAVIVILDSEYKVAAHSQATDGLVGQQGDSALILQLRKHAQGTFETVNPEGVAMQTSYMRSPRSGWTVAIELPLQSLNAWYQHDLAIFAAGASTLLTLSLWMAWLVAKRIVQSVRVLHDAAVALGTGTLAKLPPVALLEAKEVKDAMAVSAQLLKTRTRELLDANAALHDRTAELAEAQNIAQIGNWSWHFKDNVVYASDEMVRLFGPNALAAPSGQTHPSLPPGAWQQLEAAVNGSIQSGTDYGLDLIVLNKEGKHLWVNARGKTERDSQGRVIGLRGTVQDITQSRAAADSVRENATRLKMALVSSDLALWDWNIGSDELFFDERWASIQGYAPIEMQFSNAAYLKDVFTEDIPVITDSFDRHFRGINSKYEAVYRVRHKDGQWVWVQSTGRLVERDALGKPLRMLGVAFDVTERKNHEQAMENLHDEMNAMLVWQVAQHTVAALAHEINQPLASLSILCEVALRKLPPYLLLSSSDALTAKGLAHTISLMNAEIERAGRVLRKLLISVNKPDITRTDAVVNDMVNLAIRDAQIEGVNDCPISTDLAGDLPHIKANWLQLNKVLLNLIHNAAQAMHAAQSADRRMVISTQLLPGGREICISVQDSGPGISDLMQQEIFQPFITTKSHGLGLGLTISRALVEAHGGKLWATSPLGQGATFHITLPIEM
jgi:PAS domain S-box-containing protein